MKKLLFLFLCFFTLETFAQKRSINNKLSTEHIFIPATKIAIIPPPNFAKAVGFSGFQQAETNSSILIAEIPAPYPEMVKSFTAENLKTRGVILIKTEDISFQNTPAKLFITKQSANGMDFSKTVLVFGDSKRVILVNFLYPENDKTLAEQMDKTISSLVYQSTKQVTPLEEANFKINTADTKFKFAHSLSGSLIFTSDGQLPPADTDKAFLSVSQILINTSTVLDKKILAIETMQKFPNGKKTKIEKVSTIEIDGLTGYEVIGTGENEKGQKELVYEVMLFSNSSYYTIVGISPTQFDSYLQVYKSIAKTFERKL